MHPNDSSHLLAVDSRHLEPLVMRIRQGEPDAPPDATRAGLSYFRGMNQDERPYELVGSVAILRLRGFLAKRGWWCDTSFDRFSDMVRFAVNDYAVKTILIDCDSPGGSVYGCADCADVVYHANNSKRVICCVNDLCASAALWVGTAAREVVITQSGDLGSIGVYQMRMDVTEAMKKQGVSVEIIRAGEQKAWGSPFLPMTDAERKVKQDEVDAIYQQFINAVARNRGADPGAVRRVWADARIFSGVDAVRTRLADRVASFDQVLTELVGRPTASNGLGSQQTGIIGQASTRAARILKTTTRRFVGYVKRPQ